MTAEGIDLAQGYLFSPAVDGARSWPDGSPHGPPWIEGRPATQHPARPLTAESSQARRPRAAE